MAAMIQPLAVAAALPGLTQALAAMKIVALALLVASLPVPCSAGPGDALKVLRISADQRALELQRLGDGKPQRIEVLEKCGVPAVGDPTIRWFEPNRDTVRVGYGKHCVASVSIRKLTVDCSGCD